MHLIHKSVSLAIHAGNTVRLFNLRSQTTESEVTLPERVVAMTSCREGGEFTILCSNNHLIQLTM